MESGLLLKVALSVVGALILVAPFSNPRRFREQVFRSPVGAWMTKRRPDLTERVVTLHTVAFFFGVIGLVVMAWIVI
ncbi:hypothetical protein GCM10010413_41090 [Promicromonospora sukumoe]|uniref:Uncharacterized protein n=1 Tax=Promicromonospora sukumoe TaxID=88382 RepID=A0A7W3PGP3_9MICO|nr:hypothetical protein [Promicromonospora sukumoe]MBA8811183.1 hypothetical protein [Promicromonospora sukumoe]